MLLKTDDLIHWHWNDFESGGGGHTFGAKPLETLLSCPPLFWIYKYN